MRAKNLVGAALLAALAIGSSACESIRTCATDTVFVDLTLEGAAANATSVELIITVDGRTATRTVNRSGSSGTESIELRFPGGYPAGKTVRIDAVANGIGGSASVTAAAGCTRVSIRLSSPVGVDLAGGGSDLAMPADLSLPTDDLATPPDLTVVTVNDLAMNDLTPVQDMTPIQDMTPVGCSGTCVLTAVHPAAAPANATIVVEGNFGSTVTVNFPGGVSATATVLGAQRAVVAVPTTATAGPISVTTGGQTVGAIHFRRTSFTPTLGAFSPHFAQENAAVQMPKLATQRAVPACAFARGNLYVAGGYNGAAINTVDRFRVNQDGTLGRGAAAPVLSTARGAATAITVGPAGSEQLYVVGGYNAGGTHQTSIDQATFGSGGAITGWTAAPALVTARWGAGLAVIGQYLYVVGGNTPSGLASSIERAPISATGTLGSFQTVASTLIGARQAPMLVVTRGYLYVLGGYNGAALTSVERAPINGDGSLGTFAAAGTIPANHDWATAVHLADRVYLLGGSSTAVETATIDGTGALGSFGTVVGVALTSSRPNPCVVSFGNEVYVAGGFGFDTIERATIVGGLPSTFSTLTGVTLANGRYSSGQVVIGNYVYQIGGYGAGSAVLGTVERAQINVDGTIGTFAAVAASNLVTARGDFATAVIGDGVYVLGGYVPGTGALTSVERAPIAADGTLGTFATVAGVTVSANRYNGAAVATRDYLYLVGGWSATVVERSSIDATGNLGSFASYSSTLATGRSLVSSFVSGTTFYLVGGSATTGGATLRTIESATLANDGALGATFGTNASQMVTGRGAVGLFLSSNNLGVYGGIGSGIRTDWENAPFTPPSTIGSFASVASLPAAKGNVRTLVLGNWAYAVGGIVAGGNPTNAIDRAEIR